MFQRARNDDQVSQRRTAILNAAEGIYSRDGLAGLTLTTISKETSLTRQALYRYYRTKEEVLLDLLKREYQGFIQRLSDDLGQRDDLTAADLAALLTDQVLARPLLPQLFAILYSVIEVNVAYDRLVDFKRLVFSSFEVFHVGLSKVWHNPTKEKLVHFDYQFLLYLSALYPLSHPTAEQARAMAEISPDFQTIPSHQLCYEGLLALLS